MAAVFLAGMNRNPEIGADNLDSRVRGNDVDGVARVKLKA